MQKKQFITCYGTVQLLWNYGTKFWVVRPVSPIQHVVKMVGEYAQATRNKEIVTERQRAVTMVGLSSED
ncbi:hypothetical protein TSUD_25020 [Trifolium subterraneum]|uniref:Uncharacterized protein n=1 Tax=Trifolium subterraneum TaxID=3900 RepID=A0A2Z6P8V3_TRISU|nr:hypothetical protein TSUD_25020 [Trifolium subterraneum]